VSGVTGDQDEQCSKAGLGLHKKLHPAFQRKGVGTVLL
jgi:hypothetical protein